MSTEPEPGKRPCKYCGAQLLFVRSAETEKIIPLQIVTSLYVVDDERDRALKLAPPQIPDPAQTILGVNHWQTCPKAQQAKAAQERKRKREGDAKDTPARAAGARKAAGRKS